MSPATKTPVRTLRADARRNREAVLEAARERFADEGTAAQIDDIARDAGVGVGTVYRHFPTKEDLIEALVARRFERLAERGAQAIEEGRDDAWQAFSDYMYFSVGLQASDRALSQVMAAQPDLMRKHAESSGTWDHTQKLVGLAQRSGELRKDAMPEDVPMIICGLGMVTSSGEGGATPGYMDWKRFLALALEGLRAPGGEKLPKRSA
jgi:AcrR family transcriptional regulator